MITLHQARGDNADHTFMPVIVADKNNGRLLLRRRHFHRRGTDVALDLAALLVQVVESRGKADGLATVAGRE